MARPIAGDAPALPPAPFPAQPAGAAAPAGPQSPFSYAGQPHMPAPGMTAAPTPAGLINAFRRRWVLGTLLGALAAAAVAAAAWLLMPSGKHEARAIVQLRSRNSELGGRSLDDFAEYRGRQIFLLKSRDLITRAVNEPGVSHLDMIRNADDPVQMIEEHLKVKAATDDIILVTLTGNSLEEMKVFLDHLVKLYVGDAAAYDRKDMDEQIKRMERLAESQRVEVEAGEKQIELLSRVNSTTGGEDNAKRLALLQQQYITAEADYHRLGRDLLPLEAEFNLLKAQSQDQNAPAAAPDPDLVEQVVNRDPRVGKAKDAADKKKLEYEKALETAGGQEDVPFVVEKKSELDKAEKEYGAAKAAARAEAVNVTRAYELTNRKNRAADLEQSIKIKKEVREKIKEERDTYKKLIDAGVGGGLNIQNMRDALKPQKEMR
jgi:hypothetical protein